MNYSIDYNLWQMCNVQSYWGLIVQSGESTLWVRFSCFSLFIKIECQFSVIFRWKHVIIDKLMSQCWRGVFVFVTFSFMHSSVNQFVIFLRILIINIMFKTCMNSIHTLNKRSCKSIFLIQLRQNYHITIYLWV